MRRPRCGSAVLSGAGWRRPVPGDVLFERSLGRTHVVVSIVGGRRPIRVTTFDTTTDRVLRRQIRGARSLDRLRSEHEHAVRVLGWRGWSSAV